MKAILVNYNYTPTWFSNYDLEVRLYDRSDDGIERNLTNIAEVYKTDNYGDVDYDKLSYLVDSYDNLPDIFLWGKSNIFKYVDEPYFKDKLEKKEFAPLLKQDHRIYSDRYGSVNGYQGEIYLERADSWFFNNPDLDRSRNWTWDDWCSQFRLPKEPYIPFAPGGNYLLTRERVHRYSKDFYDEMRSTLPYAMHPSEAHACERSYYLLWR